MPEIEQITLWDANDLMAYWQEHPPTHVLVAAYLLGNAKLPGREGKRVSKLDALSHAITGIGGSLRGKLPEVYRS